jgi:hypothetical protein
MKAYQKVTFTKGLIKGKVNKMGNNTKRRRPAGANRLRYDSQYGLLSQ